MKKGLKYFFDSWFPFVIFSMVTTVVFYALWDANKTDISTVDQIFSNLDVASANGLAVLAFISMLVLASRKFRRKINHEKSIEPKSDNIHGALIIVTGSRGNADENKNKLHDKFNIAYENMEVVSIGKGQKNVESSIVPDAKEKIEEAYATLAERSVDDIFLMIAAPLPIAFMIGDVLNNKLPVYVIKHPEFEVWYVTENNHIKQKSETIEGYEHS